MYWFEPSAAPEMFDPARHPVYIGAGTEGREFYGFPACDGPGRGPKIAFFHQSDRCTADSIERRVDPAEVTEMATFARRWLPTLPGRFLRAATCLYTTTPDEHFVVGAHPEHANVTVACGFSGHGFKFVPVVGEILADLATAGRTRHRIHPLFDPVRPALTGGR